MSCPKSTESTALKYFSLLASPQKKKKITEKESLNNSWGTMRNGNYISNLRYKTTEIKICKRKTPLY